MTPKKELRFDHVMKAMNQAYTNLLKNQGKLADLNGMCRRDAYRVAKSLEMVQVQFHNQFLDIVAGEQTTIAEWIDRRFQPIEQMGEDRKNLIQAIRDGMTEREYVEQGSMWRIRRDAPKLVARERVLVTMSEPPADTNVYEQVKYLGEQNKALKMTTGDLRRALEAALKENNLLRKKVGRLEGMLRKFELKIHGFINDNPQKTGSTEA